MWRARIFIAGLLALCCAAVPATARGAERVTLTNGFDMVCDHTAALGAQTLLYLDAGDTNYIAVQTNTIQSTVAVAVPLPPPYAPAAAPVGAPVPHGSAISAAELGQLVSAPGKAHDLDVDLLLSVVHAESNGQAAARSRAGAEGLMQLMPGTARQLGVKDAWAAEQNVAGGTAYLDTLLRRYRGNLELALAAYNAGPGAVDRWHGIPPYAETRAYVARIIHEYNRRYRARQAAALALAAPASRP